MRDVLVVVYDGIQLLDVVGPLEVFDAATLRHGGRGGGYRVRLASVGGRDVVSSSGVRLGVHADLEAHPPDTLVVAGGWGYPEAARGPDMVRGVRRLAAGSRRVTSVCTGAFILAAAGLLDGRRATTHWAFCDALADAHPSVTVVPDAIFVRDGTVVTAAGVTAGMDLALALLEEDEGAEAAREIAKWLVVFLQRPGGQSQFSVHNRTPPVQDGALRRLLDQIAADPAGDLSVGAMADRLSMSTRHFSRFFTKEVGCSPGRYVERARVEAARLHLETGDAGVDTVARLSGFGTTETMRRTFLREIGVPPSAYRARFRTAVR
ncbi:GlxA family transcriptional regulator [Actinomadura barringtoniae]|uniref:GlxA family transcriptional regulator n=1 Tax=Actinomadura barringtoniae TaxID=1427535 RepID=A0A939TB02_9ACTN|nr:GlxA family transcriptional regulator [Actinomadura barringtoniae]MBO2453037.1 GlxA family transcriptional regulator [Actinomadura barringtoniae]